MSSSSNPTQTTASLSNVQVALDLHRTLNARSKRSAAATRQPDRYGDRATAREVNQAINDGQGTSVGLNSAGHSLETHTHKNTPRIY